jgi:hypothetical protein
VKRAAAFKALSENEEWLAGEKSRPSKATNRLNWIGFEDKAVYEIRGNHLYELAVAKPTYEIRGNKIYNLTGGPIYEIR